MNDNVALEDDGIDVLRLDVHHAELLKVKDAMERRDKAHKEIMAKYNLLKEECEANILAIFKKTRQTSAKTDYGTLYTTIKGKATVGDKEAFMEYVKQNNAFELLDAKANVTATRDFVEANKVPPPGVNWSQYMTLNSPRSK